MDVMKGLIVKDWKLSFKAMWQNLSVLFIVWLISIGLAMYYNDPLIVTGIGGILLSAHIFYIGVDIAISLHKETKSMQWLHNPNSSLTLLSSKLFVSFITFLFSLLITGGLLLLSTSLLETPIWKQSEELWEIGVLFLAIVFVSLYLGTWLMFIWTMIKCVSIKGAIGSTIQALIGLLGLLIFYLHQLFFKSTVYGKLNELGKLSFPTFEATFENEAVSFGMQMEDTSLGIIAFYALISIGLLLLSAWCMEKKMEM
ncbi:hypothetical protein ACFVAD_03695 [Sutcliffiella sp. NPDC057660]|uniref:hypothetical protein n=1 Tax=Sutcliffiella sp. NPDC057660 TaxID=3346199 RepID=UPI00369696C8